MKTTERLKRAFRHPKLFLRQLNRLYFRRGGLYRENPSGHNFVDEDWDNLVILDACRYDMFESVDLPGALSTRNSLGSATTEFLQANFDGRDLQDTVYVTANPQLHRHWKQWDINFHAIIQPWQGDGWDREYETVLPETMVDHALEAAETYPRKRLIVHFMQPHYPFLTDTEFDKGHLSKDESGDDENLWSKKFFDELEISEQEIWEAYTETLHRAVPSVHELLVSLDGKTVVTADHGNAVGDRCHPLPIREWGHPRGVYMDVLVKVPWLEYTNGDRKNISSDGTTGSIDAIDSATVDSRLKHLGYKT